MANIKVLHELITLHARLCFLFIPVLAVSIALAQTPQGNSRQDLIDLQNDLNLLVRQLDKKSLERARLQRVVLGAVDGDYLEEREALKEINEDITRITLAFEMVVLKNLDSSQLSESAETTLDLREELLDVVKPLLDSVKAITKRPRQLSELRSEIEISESRIDLADQALFEIGSVPAVALSDNARDRLQNMATEWQENRDKLSRELRLAQAQLKSLTNGGESFFSAFWPSVLKFVTGRGLTLVLAACAAVVTWLTMRFLWWVYESKVATKEQRRRSNGHRFASYGYRLLTLILLVVTILIVLYAREDLLLLALAFLLIAGAALSFRQFIPRYSKEARLLLNIGPVREEEVVHYNGLPWLVMSLNIFTVLRNPALEGVIRLPLESLSSLVSYPARGKSWFPTSRGDVIMLPDDTLGTVLSQSPENVAVLVRGGMTVMYPTAEFYRLNVLNLSASGTFGVSITFGLDYRHQQLSLTEIPQKLRKAQLQGFTDAGYGDQLKNLIVELSAAGASSLDYLLFVTMDSAVASDYFKIQRLMQQICVSTSNDNGWGIPYPQLTIHGAEKHDDVFSASHTDVGTAL